MLKRLFSTPRNSKKGKSGSSSPSTQNNVIQTRGRVTSLMFDDELEALKISCLSYINHLKLIINETDNNDNNDNTTTKGGNIASDDDVFKTLKEIITRAKKQLNRTHDKTETKDVNNKFNKSDANMNFDLTNQIQLIDDIALPNDDNEYSVMSLTNANKNKKYTISVSSKNSNYSDENKGNSHTSSHKSSVNTPTTNNVTNNNNSTNNNNVTKDMDPVKRLNQFHEDILNKFLIYIYKTERFILSISCKKFYQTFGIGNYSFSVHLNEDSLYWHKYFSHLTKYNETNVSVFSDGKEDVFTDKDLEIYNKFFDINECGFINIHYETFDNLKKSDLNMLMYYIIFYERFVRQYKIRSIKYFDDVKRNNNDDNKESNTDDGTMSKGSVLLKQFRSLYDDSNIEFNPVEHGLYIPDDIQGISISNSKNKNISKWIARILCYLPNNSCIDYIKLTNCNFSDRDIHIICASLINRNDMSNLFGIDLSENAKISDQSIKTLLQTIGKKCHKLQFINIKNCTKITNKTCKNIVKFLNDLKTDNIGINLQYINLSGTKINGNGIDILNNIFTHPSKHIPYNSMLMFECIDCNFDLRKQNWSRRIKGGTFPMIK